MKTEKLWIEVTHQNVLLVSCRGNISLLFFSTETEKKCLTINYSNLFNNQHLNKTDVHRHLNKLENCK